MNQLILALLALATVMVVFATAVTVIQQGIFKLAQTRRGGMQHLLKRVHQQVVAPNLRNERISETVAHPDSAQAHDRFALDMSVNHVYSQPGLIGWLSRLPFGRRYFGGRFERMSTRQFAEQLARTDAGAAIAHMDDDRLKEVLRNFAYEFERFGEAQIEVFRRRAQVNAVTIGVILALAFNVDILHMMKVLMSDQSLAERVIDDAANSLASQHQATQSTGETASEINAEAQQQLDRLRLLQRRQTELGLPIGATMFPFCAKPIADHDALANQFAQALVDSRCDDLEPVGLTFTADLSPAQAAAPPAPAANNQPKAHVIELNCKTAGQLCLRVGIDNWAELWRRVTHTGFGYTWLLSVLIAGGCFGLGAPFWYSFIARLASASNSRSAARLAQVAEAAVNTDGAAAAAPTPIRGSDLVTPDDLLTSFRTVSRTITPG